MWKEFKEFILRGNVVELAVGLAMGTAFTAIVNSLVNDIIMPFVAGLVGRASVKDLSYTFNNSPILYGAFLQAIINFLLIAIVLFLLIKGLNTMAATFKREKEEKVEEEKDIPSSEDYLREIRDLLAEQKNINTINHNDNL